MKAALRLVRFYGGGVGLSELLASSRLMRLAEQTMREEIAGAAAVSSDLADDMAFLQNATAFFAEKGAL